MKRFLNDLDDAMHVAAGVVIVLAVVYFSGHLIFAWWDGAIARALR